jgi:hypothetical protein
MKGKSKIRKKENNEGASRCKASVVIISRSATDEIGNRTELSRTPSFWELKN